MYSVQHLFSCLRLQRYDWNSTKFETGLVTLITHISRRVVILARTCYDYLIPINEVSVSTAYEDMEGDKTWKLGWFEIATSHSRSLGTASYNKAHTISY